MRGTMANFGGGNTYAYPRENEGTERGTPSPRWDMSIPLKLYIDWPSNGRVFSETSA